MAGNRLTHIDKISQELSHLIPILKELKVKVRDLFTLVRWP